MKDNVNVKKELKEDNAVHIMKRFKTTTLELLGSFL